MPETIPVLWALHLIATSLISPRRMIKTSTAEFHNTIRPHCLALLWAFPSELLNYWTPNVLNTLTKYLLLEWLVTVKLKAINFLPTSITEKMVSPKKTALQRVVGLFCLLVGDCCVGSWRGSGLICFFESHNPYTKNLAHITVGFVVFF